LGIGFLWLGPYLEVTVIAFYDIANGSLRPVRRDPITVYKDPEIADPGGEPKDVE
jgi:hypothetical protein